MVQWQFVSICVSLALYANAAPTWPSTMDELEDIMFLNTGYRAKGFSTEVTPCSFSSKGPGRITAAEWIRTAFHDMIAGVVSSTAGGMDASIMYETKALENIGTAFNSSLLNFAPFFSSRSSMADLIAMGMYTAVRSCGGPVIPIRTGRIDATRSGATAFVPQPQNSVGTFQNQFNRVGFNLSDMIAVTACGHTTGGVHAAFFPEIVPAGTAPDDFAQFDKTATFDTKIATDFLANNSTDPLVVGPSTKNTRDSDGRIFKADNNVTITSLTNPDTFRSTCARVLQKLIDVVPTSVRLTDPLIPYEAKPIALQLRLLDGGSSMAFTGEIRIRTTTRSAAQIASVQLVYRDRTGGNVCGACTIDASTEAGRANGFDDSFSFFSFASQIQANSSISSFNIAVTRTDGQQEIFDNNGAGYPVQDSIILQSPQSCIKDSASPDKKNMTIVAAVRDETATLPVNTSLVFKVARRNVPIDIPALSVESYTMSKQYTVGPYSLYALAYALNTSQALNTVFNVSAGAGASRLTDAFKLTSDLPSECCYHHAAPTPTPTFASNYQGCYIDSVSGRALNGSATNDHLTLTLANCATFCSEYSFYGLEYTYQCFCGNTLNSVLAPEYDCNMPCSGDDKEICGGPDRLSVYQNEAYIAPANPPIEGYEYKACYVDMRSARVLGPVVISDDTGLTVGECKDYCNGSRYFGTEYGRECWCGNELGPSATVAPESDCFTRCAGDRATLCGAPDRLSLYQWVDAKASRDR
ncbi:heme peroxidase [Pseudovirgaria hyperparasitica]|uniref:Heme peroxidase n=1 Tax=Pseudovirgaria hyperparasitica TaxID=470096 RepID=A0A6A6WBM6_9PEZI|nr:heme peroxidase [Pseudovirgaria hyperparasitica]KAF2758511.1 heme peroxidase [Pseudovirgaria hyperparasitica]